VIPPFSNTGYLPPGIHPATLVEIEARFGQESEIRRVQMDSVRWMVALAQSAGVARIVLNGSFVTDIMEPNDVDCVLLLPRGSLVDRAAFRELRKGLPFLDIAVANDEDFDVYVNETFASDRLGAGKGMIEVVIP
jgi:hypothetical protein